MVQQQHNMKFQNYTLYTHLQAEANTSTPTSRTRIFYKPLSTPVPVQRLQVHLIIQPRHAPTQQTNSPHLCKQTPSPRHTYPSYNQRDDTPPVPRERSRQSITRK